MKIYIVKHQNGEIDSAYNDQSEAAEHCFILNKEYDDNPFSVVETYLL